MAFTVGVKNVSQVAPGPRAAGQVEEIVLPGSPVSSPELEVPRQGWAPAGGGLKVPQSGLTAPQPEQPPRLSWLQQTVSFRTAFNLRKTEADPSPRERSASMHTNKASVSGVNSSYGRTSLSKAAILRMRTQGLGKALGNNSSWTVQWTACFDLLILLNTVVMALEAQHRGLQNDPSAESSEEVWPGADTAFLVLDWFFGIIFLLELLTSLYLFKKDVYRSVWGYLDTAIVLFWFIGVVIPGALPVDSAFLRVARLARLLRILRLVKAIKGFDSLYLMTTAIKSSVAALGWSIALLGVVQVMIALLLGQLLSSYWLDPEVDEAKRHAVYRYYGSFSKAILTMFELMLANWPVASRIVTENVSEWYMTPALFYQLVITFAVGKVIMGVFLQVTFHVASTDDTIMLRQQERAAALQRRKIGMFFSAIDEDGSSTIDRDEFRTMLDDEGVRKWLSAMEVDVAAFFEKEEDADVLYDLFRSHDKEQVQLLSAESFVVAMGRMKGAARNVDLHVLLRENRRSSRLLSQIRADCHKLRAEIMQARGRRAPSRAASQEIPSRLSQITQCTIDSSAAFAGPTPSTPRDERDLRGPKVLGLNVSGEIGRNSLDPTDLRRPNRRPGAQDQSDEERLRSKSSSGEERRGSKSRFSSEEERRARGSKCSDIPIWPPPPEAGPTTWPDAPEDEAPVVPLEERDLRVTRPPRPSVEQLKTLFRSGSNMTLPAERWSLKTIVGSNFFEVFVLFFIVMNTAVMALEAQYKGLEDGYEAGFVGMDTPASEVWPGAPMAFDILDWFFGLLFTLELLLKLIVLRQSYWRDLSNLLDGTIVLSWLLTKAGNLLPMDPTFLRLIRLTRLLRLIRIAKAIQGFDALYVMMTSLKASCSALLWSSVVLFLLQTMIALVLQVFLEDFVTNQRNDPAQRELVYNYFGTFSKATFSLFEVTLANWIPVSRILTETVSEWYVIFVLGHKFVIGFAVVTVLTGVFLQETFKVAQTDNFIMMTKRERAITTHTEKMQKLFAAADTDSSGVLNKEEFMGCVDNPTVKTWLAAMGLQVSDAALLFDMIDDGDGELTAEELVKGVARMKGGARALDMAVLMCETTRLNERLARTRDEIRQLCASDSSVSCANSVATTRTVASGIPPSSAIKIVVPATPERCTTPEWTPTHTGNQQALLSLREKLLNLAASQNKDGEPVADADMLQECLLLASTALGEDDPSSVPGVTR